MKYKNSNTEVKELGVTAVRYYFFLYLDPNIRIQILGMYKMIRLDPLNNRIRITKTKEQIVY